LIFASRIAAHFADRPFSVVDVGGGNGTFADRLLEASQLPE
jgi:SAM-dependent MidA family methyltransferase